MDSNNISTPDREVPDEHVEGHQMCPLDDEDIIIAEGGGIGAAAAAAATDNNLDGSQELELPQEYVQGHQMWPIDDDDIIIAEGGGDGNKFGVSQGNAYSDDHSIKIYFKLRDGIHWRTLKGTNLYSEDMFMSQDPELSHLGLNDPRENLCETPKVDVNGLCTINETQDDPDINLNALCDNDKQEEMSETPQLDK